MDNTRLLQLGKTQSAWKLAMSLWTLRISTGADTWTEEGLIYDLAMARKDELTQRPEILSVEMEPQP